MGSRRKVHYVLSTHWDREWYQAFQDYRKRLVALMDDILARLDSGELRGPFTSDGQAVMLEDYLEVRRERREQVTDYLKKGLLSAGPWYVMPDEFLVSGESLVRNLRVGRETVRRLGGEPSSAGFVCDIFGHCSQLPQIFLKSNIQGGLIWRGINNEEQRDLIWVGADGSRLPCHRFPRNGYCDFAIDVRKTHLHGLPFEDKRVRRDWHKYLDKEAAACHVDPILVFDGADHQGFHPEVYATIFDEQVEGFELVHSSLDAYLEELRAQEDRIGGELRGELRDPARWMNDKSNHWLISGVGSSRVQHKQANSYCETLLCHWAEPMTALAGGLLGTESAEDFLEVAWRWLLKNHAHDSICGCSIDQVHRDMRFRFDQCRLIGEGQTLEAMQALAAQVEGDLEKNEHRVLVFNPLPFRRPGVYELELAMPPEWPKFNEFFGYESKPAFNLYDASGEEVPYQRLGQQNGVTHRRIQPLKFPDAFRRDHVRVAVELELPATGFLALTLRPGKAIEAESEDPNDQGPGLIVPPTRYPAAPGLAVGETALENESLRVELGADAGLTLTDKTSGHRFEGLLRFEDEADIGDGWYHGVAINDRVFTSVAAPASISLEQDNPLLAVLCVRSRMRVPERFDFPTSRRSDALVDLEIVSRLTLRKGEDFVDVETEFVNSAADHRLRLVMSTMLSADTYWTDTPYDAVERAVPLRSDNHLYRELEVEAKPQQFWTAISDGKTGLAVVTEGGLLESTVRDRADRPIAMTLLRSTRRTVMTDGEPDGLMLGERLRYRYRVLPLRGPVDPFALGLHGQCLAAKVRSVQLEPQDQEIHLRKGGLRLAPGTEGLRIEGEALMTSLRVVGGGTELRLYNPRQEPTAFRVHWEPAVLRQRGWKKVFEVDFESNPVPDGAALGLEDCSGSLTPREICTFRWE